MPALRRKSGNSAEVTKSSDHPVDDLTDSDSDMLDTEHEHDLDVESEESEDEGSDWEQRTSRTANGKARAKRAKLSDTARPKKRTQLSKSNRNSLSLLPMMPMDILFEILGRLSPKDLLSLARTNKSLRATLMSRNSITVWKSARGNVGCPDCPSDFSEPRWAALVFGSTCESCGTTNVFKVDFGIRRRVCVPCKKNNLVVTSKFSTVFPKYDDTILSFIPHTNVGGWAHGHASGSKFYWRSDVHATAGQLLKLKEDVRKNVSDAKKKLNEFQLQRMSIVLETVENVPAYNNWYESLATTEDRRLQRYNAIIEKFRAIGYLEADIRSGISDRRECHQNALLTDRIWKRIQPILEPFVVEKRDRRLAAAREALIKERKGIVDVVYKSYLKTLVPSQWLYHPRPNKIYDFLAFDQVLNAPDGVNVNESSFDEAKSMLPGLISAWNDERRAALEDKIPSQSTNDSGTDVSSMNLATTVFECVSKGCEVNSSPWGIQHGNPLFGWEDAGAHHCNISGCYWLFRDDPAKERELAFSKKGSDAAASLVSLAGFNPARATPANMDFYDLRFFCTECTARKNMNGRLVRQVFSWRSAVAHAMKNSHENTLTWQLLTPEESRTVKRSEALNPVPNDKCWTCSSCNTFFDNLECRAVVVEHLKNVHGKPRGTVPQDLFYLPDKRRSTIPASMLELPAPPNAASDTTGIPEMVRCARCAPPSDRRIFKMNGVLAHLKDKHKIQKPSNKDWIVDK